MPDPTTVPDEAVVLRAGIMRIQDLLLNAMNTWKEFQRPGISVRAGVGVTDRELMSVPSVLEYRQMRRSTAAGVREAGRFDLSMIGDPHHCTIWIPDVHSRTLDALIRAFGPPESNPAYPSFR